MSIQQLSIDQIGLSVRSKNALHSANINTVSDLMDQTPESLNRISRLGQKSIDEIMQKIQEYSEIIRSEKTLKDFSVFDYVASPEYHDRVFRYVVINDLDVSRMGFSSRTRSDLTEKGLAKMSDIVFLTRRDLLEKYKFEPGQTFEVLDRIHKYLLEHRDQLIAVCRRKQDSYVSDAAVRRGILEMYHSVGFRRIDLAEMHRLLNMPISQRQLLRVANGMIADHQLKCEDKLYSCIYGSFFQYLDLCTEIDNRSKDMIRKKLHGDTLAEIGKRYGMTRERVRQIIFKGITAVSSWYCLKTGNKWFTEDSYRYFYSTYAFDRKDGMLWFGFAPEIYHFLTLFNVDPGKKDISLAPDDPALSMDLRHKIQAYLNRKNICIDGEWIPKQRSAFEHIALRELCQDEVTFDDFAKMFNEFLRSKGIPYDRNLYYTETVLATRKNLLIEDRFLLWKQNSRLRYYDIDGHDYTELLDTLNLDAYENIELSTQKFLEEYPDVMKKYDIRDRYELHNLLRKIIPDGSYHDFHCGKMPHIRFGTFDRDAAIYKILLEHSPIGWRDLCNLVHAEYGYDQDIIQANFLKSFEKYRQRGLYIVDQKVMNGARMKALLAHLDDDMYAIKEIKEKYLSLFPDADPDEVNSYSLCTMGFQVLTQHVLRNFPSIEAYFENRLTRDDIVDLGIYRKRFSDVQAFYAKQKELKKSRRVVELEPHRFIQFHKLEEAGISQDKVQAFCDSVYAFVDDGTYFNVQSLRQDGFTSDLFAYNFSSWFFDSLLAADERFSSGKVYNSLILCKGGVHVNSKSFLQYLVRRYGSIGVSDLLSNLEDRFGCLVLRHIEPVYKACGEGIVYDSVQQILYANSQHGASTEEEIPVKQPLPARNKLNRITSVSDSLYRASSHGLRRVFPSLHSRKRIRKYSRTEAGSGSSVFSLHRKRRLVPKKAGKEKRDPGLNQKQR
ncbi:MAG: hypothetical protein IJ773_02090 [Lachnospiraceae bacterium]|nr:hypothetical protein [Lachnospiraceae bacterium]